MQPIEFSQVEVIPLWQDKSLEVRAITIKGDKLYYATNQNRFGEYNISSTKWKHTPIIVSDSSLLNFRSIARTASHSFVLSIANPARLYKIDAAHQYKIVYEEVHENVFYDSMRFWNNREGIAMGDPTNDCMSVILTRDGGNSWYKIDCSQLPQVAQGEAAFAASNTNIAIYREHTWIASGGKQSRVFYSGDKGKNWKVFNTPIIQGLPTQGMYSLDFYNAKIGVAVGGDYTKPKLDTGTAVLTTDGGKTWKRIGDGGEPTYKSCVQFVPGKNGEAIVALG
ncbi:MAG: oxidoreductase, partial [Flavobacteriaceae bacterium]|nr:oxidoreductase [Flavobacteriaceae bacterium]